MNNSIISINNLNYKYASKGKSVLKNINLDIAKSEIFGILGPSGSGKSTLQKILWGLLAYTGDLNVFGKPIAYWKLTYYEKIGVCFEFPNHYLKFTALENLNFFASLHQTDCVSPEVLLSQVGLDKDKHTKVAEFSKGMMMRLNLARALLNKPQILYLDEPTSGLDPYHTKIVENILFEQQNAGTTIFLTSHDMNFVDKVCDRVAFLFDGEIIACDTTANLKQHMGQNSLIVSYLQNDRIFEEEFPLANIGENLDFLACIKSEKIQSLSTVSPTLSELFMDIHTKTLKSKEPCA